LAAVGLVGAVLGALSGSAPVAGAYAVLVVVAGYPALQVIRTPEVIGVAFGTVCPTERREGECHALQRRWGIHLGGTPEPRWQRDIPFWTPLEPTKPLLCDIWQPPASGRPAWCCRTRTTLSICSASTGRPRPGRPCGIRSDSWRIWRSRMRRQGTSGDNTP